MAELPLITILALERANKNCYEKGLWVITNLQESLTDHRKTIEKEDLDMYCLCHSTIIYHFSFNTYTVCFHKIYCVQNYSLVVILLCSSCICYLFIVVPVRQAVNLTSVNSKWKE